MKFFSLVLVFATIVACASAAGSAVVSLDASNFDQFVGQDKPALVEFFAPWCGHCKSLAPTYEQLGETFAKSPVVIASVDADKHRDLGSKYGVSGFPTIKWFPAGSSTPEEYSGGRDLTDFIDFINRKAGTNIKAKVPKSSVTVLDDDNFDSIVLDSSKDVFVEFYAPWCGHCKRLAPDYEKFGDSFVGESNVVVAKVDADKFKVHAGKYGVTGFPTLMFFPRDNKEGEKYNGGRSPEDFVKFINQRSGTHRLVGGGYNDLAGRIEALDALAEKFVESKFDASILKEAEEAVANLKDHAYAKFAKFYTLTMKRLAEKADYAKTEVSRLNRLIEGGSVKADKLGELYFRKNIVNQFA